MPQFIGLISGTSADSIDVALIEVNPDIRFIHVLAFIEYPMPETIRQHLSHFHVPDATIPLKELAELDIKLGHCFADAVLYLLSETKTRKDEITAIGSHGQTVYHNPSLPTPYTLQLADPNTIASRTGITTIADFRKMDMALGGQGAPLVPGFHASQFSDNTKNRVIVNLGGIANITYLPANQDQKIIGFDTGPANALMDDWINLHLAEKFDLNGRWGAGGKLDDDLLMHMLDDPFFRQGAPKSTGREYFNKSWLNNKLNYRNLNRKDQDVQATLQHLTAKSVADAILSLHSKINDVILCGGGAMNKQLRHLLEAYLGRIPLLTSEQLGIHPSQVEAAAFAWLAYRRLIGKPGNIPSVTGASKACLLGGIYASELIT